MGLPKAIDLGALKTGGFIKQKEKDLFAIRLRVPVGKIDAGHFDVISEVARKYGSGNLHLTVRQGVEIQDIHFNDIQAAREELEAAGVRIGACGPRFRVVTACPGVKTCPNGLVDSAGMGLLADEMFYGRPEGLELPHKFKVTFAGCTACCPKPQENDVGFHGQVDPVLVRDECNGCGVCEVACKEGAIVMGDDGFPAKDLSKCIFCGDCIKSCPTDAWRAERTGLAVYVGGRWGRHPEMGKKIGDFISPDRAMGVISEVLKFYKEKGNRGERLGVTINRVGLDELKRRVK
jgi:anaerobic sulfite reductase subunit C